MSPANTKSFTSSFWMWISFISFSSLIPLARTSKTMLKNSGESGHACLIPNFRGNVFNFFTIENNVCCGFVIYGLSYAEVCSLYSYFLESFYHKWVLDFVKSFLCIYWDDHMVSIFQFVNMVYHTDWFVQIEDSLHPWYKAHLIHDLSNVLLDFVC